MASGGKRPNAGRKPGAATKKTREVANKAAEQGITPLEFMLNMMRTDPDPKAQFEAAKAAAPYVHARLSSVDATLANPDGSALDMNVSLNFVSPHAG